jgi:hypothetical protein
VTPAATIRGAAALLLALYAARDLFLDAPRSALCASAAAAFLVWFSAGAVLQRKPSGEGARWQASAAVFCALSAVLDLRILAHAGLACATAGLFPTAARRPVWLLTAALWLPGLDWLVRAGEAGAALRPIGAALLCAAAFRNAPEVTHDRA